MEQGKQDFEMPFTKIEGIAKEFPWITKYVFKCSIRQAYVSKITPGILSDTLANHGYPYHEYNSDGFLEWYENRVRYVREKIFLLDGSGFVVKHVEEKEIVTPACSRRKFFFFGPMIHLPEKKETIVTNSCEGSGTPTCINNIIYGLKDDADKVRFVLSFYEETGAVIVYKAPHGILIRDWIKRQIAAEQSAVKKNCAEIDAEAATA